MTNVVVLWYILVQQSDLVLALKGVHSMAFFGIENKVSKQRMLNYQERHQRDNIIVCMKLISLNMGKGKVRHKGEKELSVIFLQGFVLIAQQWGWY